MRLCLSFYIDLKSGFQFKRAMVVSYCDLLKPAFYKDFIELCKVGRLVFNEIQGQCHKDITKFRNTKISIERKVAA